MKQTLKNIGGIALGLAILCGVIVLGALMIAGSAWVSAKLLPVANVVSGLTFLLCLFVLLPMTAFSATRGFAGGSLYVMSFLFGTTLWMTGLVYTCMLWGAWGVVVGIGFLGMGVVATGLCATLFSGQWAALFWLITLLVVTYGTRLIGLFAAHSYDEHVRSKTSADCPPDLGEQRRAA